MDEWIQQGSVVENNESIQRKLSNSIKRNLGNRKGMEHTGGVALDSEQEGGERVTKHLR